MAMQSVLKHLVPVSAVLLAALAPSAANAEPFDNLSMVNEAALSAVVSGMRIETGRLGTGGLPAAPTGLAPQGSGNGRFSVRTGDITAEIGGGRGVTALAVNTGVASQNLSVNINLSINGMQVPDAALGRLF